METVSQMHLIGDFDLLKGIAKPQSQTIITVQKLTPENYSILVPSGIKPPSETINLYKWWSEEYYCDMCKNGCSEQNPIFTSGEYMGHDICEKCIQTAIEIIKSDGY